MSNHLAGMVTAGLDIKLAWELERFANGMVAAVCFVYSATKQT